MISFENVGSGALRRVVGVGGEAGFDGGAVFLDDAPPGVAITEGFAVVLWITADEDGFTPPVAGDAFEVGGVVGGAALWLVGGVFFHLVDAVAVSADALAFGGDAIGALFGLYFVQAFQLTFAGFAVSHALGRGGGDG